MFLIEAPQVNMASVASKAASTASVSFGQRIWNALSAWTIRNSGYQRLGRYRFLGFSEHFNEIMTGLKKLASFFRKHCSCVATSFYSLTPPGLRREDLYNEDGNPEVTEAIRRLPEEEKSLRLYRIMRAVDLTTKHAILPRDQWTKPEEVSQAASPIFVRSLAKPALKDYLHPRTP